MRKPYEPPDLVPLGTLFESVERRGDELAVRLTGAYFALSSALRAAALDLLAERWCRPDGAYRELVLYDASDAHRVGTFSRESGLQLI